MHIHLAAGMPHVGLHGDGSLADELHLLVDAKILEGSLLKCLLLHGKAKWRLLELRLLPRERLLCVHTIFIVNPIDLLPRLGWCRVHRLHGVLADSLEGGFVLVGGVLDRRLTFFVSC